MAERHTELFSLPPRCSIGEYTIRKGAQVLVNLWSLHHDEKEWDKPEEFNPGGSFSLPFLAEALGLVSAPAHLCPPGRRGHC